MEYTAVIRTLGTSGAKYQSLLESLVSQTLKPQKIIVYIAEGFKIPNETVNIEQYVYVKKGMVAQRALPYDEVTSEYILFLDDDLYLPPDTVENMFHHLKTERADIIAPDVLPNHTRPFLSRCLFSLSGRIRERRNDSVWGYKVMRNSGYSFNANPIQDCYISQTNAGACFLCRKQTFLDIKFEEELWMDKMAYAMGDDQVMYYKMYCGGFKQITWYSHNILHLDGGGNMTSEKEYKRVKGDVFFKVVFWHRFIFAPEKSLVKKAYSFLCFSYTLVVLILSSLIRLDMEMLRCKVRSIYDAICFLQSDEYQVIPVVNRLTI